MKKKGKEIREQEILDYCKSPIESEYIDVENRRKI